MFGFDPSLIYILAFAVFLVISISINRLLLRFSRNLGTRESDDMPRWSKEVKPSVGGIAFFIMFLIGTAAMGLMGDAATSMTSLQLAALFAASTLAFLVGLADDAYNTKPVLKFLGQFVCANMLYFGDISIELGPSDGINYFFTVLWVVGIMNSINMLDNMDAVATVVSIAILGSVLMFVIGTGPQLQSSAVTIIAVLAGLIGFLGFNWYPSRIIMGDTGSQFLGVFLSATAIIYLWPFKEPSGEYLQVRQFLIPMLIFIMPLIDTITVFARRIGRGQSPFVGGRDHTTHHLAYNGLRDDAVAVVFALISLLSLPLAWILYRSFGQWQFIYILLAIGYFVLMFIIFQVVHERGKRRLNKS